MKFLVDAQLPVRLARLLDEHGHDATHTSGLPDGNRTSDDEIAAIADASSSARTETSETATFSGDALGSFSSSTPATSRTMIC